MEVPAKAAADAACGEGRFSASVLLKVCRIACLLLLMPLVEALTTPAIGQPAIPKLVFSPWAKFCPTGRDVNGKRNCQTVSLGHTESGQPIVAAILTEPQDGSRKTLRVMVPIGVQIPQGTRLIVDDRQPTSAPYLGCFAKGCMADYEVTADLIGKLKDGQMLVVQVINSMGQPISFMMPLADFAKAHDGPPSEDAKLYHQLRGLLPQKSTQDPGELPSQIKKSGQLIYSPWTKFCLTGDGQAGQVCFTGKDGRMGLGAVAVAAVLIEPANSVKKVFRVTVPLGMEMPQGTRVIVDDSEPLTAPYIVCFSNGCMADYEASEELISRLTTGKGLTVQGINAQGKAVSFILPLASFAKAHDGPPTDSKVFEEQQRQLQEQLNRGADDKGKKGR
jgi:invasion protein IalB